MKKYLIILLVLALVLCAGCKKQEAEPTTAPTTAPTTEATEETTVPPTEETVPVPEVTMGSALVNKVPAVLSTLNREDVVDVVGEYDEDHYVIKTELGYGLVKKALLRLESEAAYEVWTGYAFWNAEVYDNMNFTGEPVQKLGTNTQVEVLDDIGYCYVVRIEGTEGFMLKSGLSKWFISSNGGGSSSGGSSTGADGGNISLQFQGGITFLGAIEQQGEVTGKAVVLATGTGVILGYFDRGEEIPMVAEAGFAEDREGYVTVYLEGIYAYVPQFMVLTEDAEVYEAWDGYSRWNSDVYDNCYLLGDPVDKLSTNVVVRVIAEFDNCYAVEINDAIGYMSKDQVSETQIYTGGSSSGGGSEWAPPKL